MQHEAVAVGVGGASSNTILLLFVFLSDDSLLSSTLLLLFLSEHKISTLQAPIMTSAVIIAEHRDEAAGRYKMCVLFLNIKITDSLEMTQIYQASSEVTVQFITKMIFLVYPHHHHQQQQHSTISCRCYLATL